MVFKGACTCGAASVELKSPPSIAYRCHCTICQRTTGAIVCALVHQWFRDLGSLTVMHALQGLTTRSIAEYPLIRCAAFVAPSVLRLVLPAAVLMPSAVSAVPSEHRTADERLLTRLVSRW